MQFQDSLLQKGLRRKLINELAQKGINDEVILQKMLQIPRHIYFDSALDDHAYEDKAFPIGEGQTISQPYTVARQTELLKIEEGQKVLEIGTGSGYQATLLSLLGVRLYTIEYQPKLYEKAKVIFNVFGLHDINCFCQDGSLGLVQFAPYDRILVTAGAPSVPKELVSQLKVGGYLVIPVGDRKQQKLVRVYRKEEKKLVKEIFEPCAFVPLVGKDGWG